MTDALKHKKEMILDAARELGVQKWTVAEIDQLRRKLLADHGEAGKTGNDYIPDVLKGAGWKIQLTDREEAEDRFEEEFEDILHFKTLQDAEVSLTRLDELLRRFRQHGERAAVERVLEIARPGKRGGGGRAGARRRGGICISEKQKRGRSRNEKRRRKSRSGSASGWRRRKRFL